MAIAMSYVNDCGFDVVEYIKKLRNVGVSQEVAEVQGQELSNAMKTMAKEVKVEIKQELDADDLATKGDLRETELRLQKEIEGIKKEIEGIKKDIELIRKDIQMVGKDTDLKIATVKNELIKWILGVGISASIITCGATFTMLKLLIH